MRGREASITARLRPPSVHLAGHYQTTGAAGTGKLGQRELELS